MSIDFQFWIDHTHSRVGWKTTTKIIRCKNRSTLHEVHPISLALFTQEKRKELLYLTSMRIAIFWHNTIYKNLVKWVSCPSHSCNLKARQLMAIPDIDLILGIG